MIEYKALSNQEGVAASSARKRSARSEDLSQLNWPVVEVTAEEFAAFERCNQTPQKPAASIKKAAKLLDRMYKGR